MKTSRRCGATCVVALAVLTASCSADDEQTATTRAPSDRSQVVPTSAPGATGVTEFALAAGGADHPVRVFVPFDGDGESVLLAAGPDPAMEVFAVQVIPVEFAEFAADARCDLSPVTSTIGDVIRYDCADCADATPMSFFEVTGGGHTWPNWPIATAVESTFGYTTTDVDATVDSWQFFQHHTLT